MVAGFYPLSGSPWLLHEDFKKCLSMVSMKQNYNITSIFPYVLNLIDEQTHVSKCYIYYINRV